MRLSPSDIDDLDGYNKLKAVYMTDVPSQPDKIPLPAKLIAAWLKHDPFVKLIAKNDSDIRRDAMMALVGKHAAEKYFGQHLSGKKLPPLVYPHHVREKEVEFLDHPEKRTHIIRELVFWGTNEYSNKENPDSHNTRIQIANSLLGPIFLNSDSRQEKLLVNGLKVIVISRPTSLGTKGESSPLVHQEILNRLQEIMHHHLVVVSNKSNHQAHVAMKAHLVKTIQTFRESSHRSAYYLADDRQSQERTTPSKFPLSPTTFQGFLEIIRHYTFSAWPEFRRQAQKLLDTLGESQIDSEKLKPLQ